MSPRRKVVAVVGRKPVQRLWSIEAEVRVVVNEIGPKSA